MGGVRNLFSRSLAFRNAVKNRLRPLFKPHHLPSQISKSSLFALTLASSQFSSLPSFHQSRSLCSAPASPGVVIVNSEEEFNNILTKVQDNSLHAIFYFTAVWCGPCRFISPIVGELSNKYPHVTTYKIDIDQEAIQGALGKLQITSVKRENKQKRTSNQACPLIAKRQGLTGLGVVQIYQENTLFSQEISTLILFPNHLGDGERASTVQEACNLLCSKEAAYLW